MNRLRRFLIRAVVAIAVLGCIEGQLGSGALAEEPLSVVRIGATMGDDFTPVLYALRAGLFRKAGLDVQVTPLGSGAAIASAIAGGSIDIGKGSLVSLMTAHVHDVPLVIVAPGSLYSGKAGSPYAALVVSTDSPSRRGRISRVRSLRCHL